MVKGMVSCQKYPSRMGSLVVYHLIPESYYDNDNIITSKETENTGETEHHIS
jgi:hypothetical protein